VDEDTARMVVEGAAYYDLEAYNGDWIRVFCEHGDLLVIPAGHCYRLTTNAKVFIFILIFLFSILGISF
jgi:1,2-dihydroxy-3-keto-5-methylthiopentene dioxygenase